MTSLVDILRSYAPSARILVALGAFAAGFQLVAAAPASLALALASNAAPEFSASKAEGTLWSGRLVGARYGDVALGDVEFALRGVSLLAGRLSVDLTSAGGALLARGRATLGLGGAASLTDATIEFDLAEARRYSFLGAPLTGKARARVASFAFDARGCKVLDATAWTDVLTAPARRLSSDALELMGPASCEAGTVVIRLFGEGVDGRVDLALAVAPDLTYQVSANAYPARREIADALKALGFSDAGGKLAFAASGALRSRGL
jgi:general secretion pathway protein N